MLRMRMRRHCGLAGLSGRRCLAMLYMGRGAGLGRAVHDGRPPLPATCGRACPPVRPTQGEHLLSLPRPRGPPCATYSSSRPSPLRLSREYTAWGSSVSIISYTNAGFSHVTSPGVGGLTKSNTQSGLRWWRNSSSPSCSIHPNLTPSADGQHRLYTHKYVLAHANTADHAEDEEGKLGAVEEGARLRHHAVVPLHPNPANVLHTPTRRHTPPNTHTHTLRVSTQTRGVPTYLGRGLAVSGVRTGSATARPAARSRAGSPCPPT
jgi:hypothetical protein